jgi:hypothetical protein
VQDNEVECCFLSSDQSICHRQLWRKQILHPAPFL